MAVVATRSGRLEGRERAGAYVFRGIPYAAPPVGPRRWQPPAREIAWDGVRDATRFGAQSAQTEFALTKLLGGTQPPCSEDSLFLNVWTPACDDARRPVMVWVHGGAFVWGAGDTPWYDGTQLARNGDVVVVTINYRLGAFGFLHLGDLFAGYDGSGNVGLLDQVAALEWVHECIGAFGGDETNVTVFGESAGAACVATLLGMPAARGRFHKAIAQSGAASWSSTRERATGIASLMCERLGVRPGDTGALLATTTQQLLGAMPRFREDGVTALPFQPVIDGVVLPRPAIESVAAGAAAHVPLLTGTNRHEMSLFQLLDPRLLQLTFDEIVALARTWVGPHASALVASYRSRRPDAAPPQVWLDLATDAVFRMPAIALVEAQLPHAPSWMYQFAWETPALGGLLRSTHALEIPFVFDTLGRGGSELLVSGSPAAPHVATAMHRAWLAFARMGDPGHDGLARWPRYDRATRATMRFDTTCELRTDPDAADRRAWATGSDTTASNPGGIPEAGP